MKFGTQGLDKLLEHFPSWEEQGLLNKNAKDAEELEYEAPIVSKTFSGDSELTGRECSEKWIR